MEQQEEARLRQDQKTFVTAIALILIVLGAAAFAPYGLEMWEGDTAPESIHGVNLAGAEFGENVIPGIYLQDYTYPSAAELDYYAGKGITLARVPFLWERLQPCLKCELDTDELQRLLAVTRAAAERDMQIIISPHNYARYQGELIGSDAVPNDAFQDFWQRLATEFRNEPGIWAYSLMNEPHSTGGLWLDAAQAGVDGIRAVDNEHTIIVPGDGWSYAYTWSLNNSDLSVNDPQDNVLYEAHVYFDTTGSGDYDLGYDGEGAHPDIGVERVQPFIDWLELRGVRGFIGEYGVPGDDPRWLETMDRFLAYLTAHGISSTYWAGGSWWGDYPLSIAPENGTDRPQMSVLERYLLSE